jgi:hypothetical protein
MRIWTTTKTGRPVKGSEAARDIIKPQCIATRTDNIVVMSVGGYMVEFTIADIQNLKNLRPAYYE